MRFCRPDFMEITKKGYDEVLSCSSLYKCVRLQLLTVGLCYLFFRVFCKCPTLLEMEKSTRKNGSSTLVFKLTNQRIGLQASIKADIIHRLHTNSPHKIRLLLSLSYVDIYTIAC